MPNALQRFMKPLSQQTVAYTGTAGTSTAIGASTSFVRIVTTTAAFITLNSTPATTAGVYMPAGVAEIFAVEGGVTISAIQAATGGNLHITEMSM